MAEMSKAGRSISAAPGGGRRHRRARAHRRDVGGGTRRLPDRPGGRIAQDPRHAPGRHPRASAARSPTVKVPWQSRFSRSRPWKISRTSLPASGASSSAHCSTRARTAPARGSPALAAASSNRDQRKVRGDAIALSCDSSEPRGGLSVMDPIPEGRRRLRSADARNHWVGITIGSLSPQALQPIA